MVFLGILALGNGCVSTQEQQATAEKERAIADKLNDLATNQDLKIILLTKYPDECVTFRFIPETQPKDPNTYAFSPAWLPYNEQIELPSCCD
jgi:hypothetical protein